MKTINKIIKEGQYTSNGKSSCGIESFIINQIEIDHLIKDIYQHYISKEEVKEMFNEVPFIAGHYITDLFEDWKQEQLNKLK